MSHLPHNPKVLGFSLTGGNNQGPPWVVSHVRPDHAGLFTQRHFMGDPTIQMLGSYKTSSPKIGCLGHLAQLLSPKEQLETCLVFQKISVPTAAPPQKWKVHCRVNKRYFPNCVGQALFLEGGEVMVWGAVNLTGRSPSLHVQSRQNAVNDGPNSLNHTSYC